jgi:hypothetical protein
MMQREQPDSAELRCRLSKNYTVCGLLPRTVLTIIVSYMEKIVFIFDCIAKEMPTLKCTGYCKTVRNAISELFRLQFSGQIQLCVSNALYDYIAV